MATLPYMPLYVADYLADTAHLTTEENGAYLLLIMNYWQRGKPLPADPVKLARIARLSNERWVDIEPALIEFFEECDGLWYHWRIEAELAKVAEKSEKARQSGKNSWKNRKLGERKANAKRTLSERSANAKRTQSYTDTSFLNTTTSEPPTEEEPDPTPPVEPPRSSSRDSNSEKSEKQAVLPEAFEKSKQRAEPPPVADTILTGTVTQDELLFPAKLNPIEVVSAYRLVCLFTLLDAQQLLDELAYRLNARHNPVHTPIAFLRTLCERHKVGAFCPSGALRVQAARAAASRQAAREAASRQQAPRGGGGDPPRKVPTAEIANLRSILRPHRAENVP